MKEVAEPGGVGERMEGHGGTKEKQVEPGRETRGSRQFPTHTDA